MKLVDKPSISIILPVRDQSDHIARVVESHYHLLRSELASSFEYILVENGSSDDSAEVCASLADRFDNVFSLKTSKVGWGYALQQGINAARGDMLCYASSARVDDKVILECLRRGLKNPRAVIQATRCGYDSVWRRLASLLYNLECRLLFGLRTADINGNPKVFPRQFKRLLHLKEEGFMIDLEFNKVCEEEGYPIIEVPVSHTRRHGGKSTTGLADGGSMYLKALLMWWQKHSTRSTKNIKSSSLKFLPGD